MRDAFKNDGIWAHINIQRCILWIAIHKVQVTPLPRRNQHEMHREKRQFRLLDEYQSVEVRTKMPLTLNCTKLRYYTRKAPNIVSTHHHTTSPSPFQTPHIVLPSHRSPFTKMHEFELVSSVDEALVTTNFHSSFPAWELGVDLHCDWRDDEKPPTLPGRACIIG